MVRRRILFINGLIGLALVLGWFAIPAHRPKGLGGFLGRTESAWTTSRFEPWGGLFASRDRPGRLPRPDIRPPQPGPRPTPPGPGQPQPGPAPGRPGPEPRPPRFPQPERGPDWGPIPGPPFPPDTKPPQFPYPPGTEPPYRWPGRLTAGNPGGVDLSSATAQFLGALGNLQGAVYDPTSRSLVVVGREDFPLPALREDDWAVALRSAYEGENTRFSLDPADPTNPLGPKLRCVYYGGIEGTHFGYILFRADLLMKRYCLGQTKPDLPGFHNFFELAFQRPAPEGTPGGTFVRLWITCDRVHIRRAGAGLVFDGITMRVNTEKMWRSRRGLASSGGEEDPIAAEAARYLTAHYEDLARAEPVFAELKQLAGAMALAKWLRELDVPIDRRWLAAASAVKVDTPAFVDAAHLTREKRTVRVHRVRGGQVREVRVHRVTLHGGVDLSVWLPADTHDPEVQQLATQVVTALRKQLTPSFPLPGRPGSLAVVAPMLGGRQ